MSGKKNAVAIAAIETVRDKQGKVIKLSVTFLNNMQTWEKDRRKTHNTKILDCRAYKDDPSPMGGLWRALAEAYGDKGIDKLVISCHSDWEGLYIFSKIRKELGEEDRYITLFREWGEIKFNPGASIELHGCQTGGREGKIIPDSIAQTIANKSGVSVWGYLYRSSQKQRPDGGYIQKPERGGLTEFVPTVSLSS